MAQAAVGQLAAAGHEVRWTRTAREGRVALREHPPDVLILDVTLEIDGLELLQALRFAPDAPPAGIVVLTEQTDVHSRERARQLSAAAVVAKPLHGDELTSVVGELISAM